jgi:hypothetical protein
MRRFTPAVLLLLALPAASARAQAGLPVVGEVPWEPLRAQCERLLKGLDALQAPLPDETVRALRSLLAKEPADADAAARAVQKLLDPHCLLAVSINPESRVKALRGPAAADLHKDRETVVLVKVHNDAGVTAPLRVSGPGLISDGKADGQSWLRAVVATEPPNALKLSGQRLEYRALRLTPRAAGKREATFRFDVGQGTQDLGFRAEVPVLFTVRR